MNMIKDETVRNCYKNEWGGENKLPVVSEIGCYDYVYLTSFDKIVCHDCAKELVNDEIEDLTGMYIHFEGPAYECDGGCGKMIESEYGDPDEEEELE